jgi:hypothetical protein
MPTVYLSLFAGAGAQFLDNSGNVLTGGKVYSYQAGTTTPLATYTTSAGNIAHPNPIILDSAGRVPSGEIWLVENTLYKFVLATANDVLIGTYDNISSNNTSFPTFIVDLANTSNPAKGDALVGFRQSNSSGNLTGSVGRTVHQKFQEIISVKDFGAVGDGVTNDTDAFAAAAAAINAAGGGKLIIPAGTYIVGKQTLAGATGLGYSYLAADLLKITNCTKSVIIEGNGAILKAANGLKFGSFDPVTGNVYNPPSLPFTDYDYRANTYWGMLEFVDNSGGIEIYDLELDGNIGNTVVGGFWGDVGRQCAGNGIRAYGNANFLAKNIYTHHHCLDGIGIGYTGLTENQPTYPHSLINVRSEYNARQGLSWVGGNNLTAIGCSFSYTGRAVFASPPSAGVDVEAELSITRNGSFTNCQMVANVGVGVLAESGDNAFSNFHDCKIIGTTTWSVWPNKPYFSFSDCLIVGAATNAYGSTTNPGEATKFTRCLFTNNPAYSATAYTPSPTTGLINFGGSSQNALMFECTFEASRSGVGDVRSTILDSCTIIQKAGTDYLSSGSNFLIAFASTIKDCTFVDGITVNVPASPYFINITLATTLFLGKNTFPSSGNLRVFSPTQPNQVDLAQSARRPFGSIMLAEVFESVTQNKKLIAFGSAVPTTGDYNQGDIIFNNAPTAGGFVGWVCVTSGTPGTWKTFGVISV